MFTVGFRDTRIPEHVALLLRGNNINNGYLIANVVFNSLLTVLTAGRIYIISREAKKYLDQSISTTYNTIVAVIAGPTQTMDPDNQSLLPVDLSPLFMQAAGIAPTLIIVRALQGKTTDSVNQVVSANNPNNRNGTATATTRSRIRFAHSGVTSTMDGTGTHHAVDLPNGHSTSGGSTGDSEKVESQDGKREEV
ncbi:hypothetical protein V5O48_001472 [Marasmius crinis-equi]|uniref:Uncharacterized protein n=1 Tax=Marasmius crinis-equi TaxID=585013 RepID=A0ABR3FYH8_9AGAR